MNRKERRAMEKLDKKQGAENFSQKILQFDKLPDECSACVKPYDKKDKQMAMTWNVVIRDEEDTVRLYCPDCWEMANRAIETLKEEFENVRK